MLVSFIFNFVNLSPLIDIKINFCKSLSAFKITDPDLFHYYNDFRPEDILSVNISDTSFYEEYAMLPYPNNYYRTNHILQQKSTYNIYNFIPEIHLTENAIEIETCYLNVRKRFRSVRLIIIELEDESYVLYHITNVFDDHMEIIAAEKLPPRRYVFCTIL